jgi:formylmethanofuran dehydrogenase subunit E
MFDEEFRREGEAMIKLGTYSYDEYVQLVKSFHGNMAPGLLIGGFMVDLAMKNFPPGELYNAICETAVCLPDSGQLLTPYTMGKGVAQRARVRPLCPDAL